MDEFKRKCFFCSDPIEGKKSMEHIIPNSLLARLGIKESTVTGERVTQYSRIKVPSHATCNNEFGSLYEDRILELLDDTDNLYDLLIQEENSLPMMYQPDDSVTSILTTWLSKIYYGLFYDDYLKTKDESWRNGHGFQLPSSLYAFKTDNKETDLITRVSPSSILLKINKITLILCVCDGYLTKNYLLGDSLESLRDWVVTEDQNNIEFPSHRLAYGEILALRNCIPKTPKFVYSENQIVNMSMSTMAANPEELYKIDTEYLKLARAEIFNEFNIQIYPSDT